MIDHRGPRDDDASREAAAYPYRHFCVAVAKLCVCEREA